MKWAQGFYKLKNPKKYIGKNRPRFRSSWEYVVMKKFDEHPNILHWASEPLRISYINPATNKHTTYVPDFLVIYENKNKEKICELIEIKPKSQTTLEHAGRSKINKVQIGRAHV